MKPVSAMLLDVGKVADELATELESLGTEDRAINEKRYLKSDLTHFGVSVPVIRKMARQFARSRKDWSGSDSMRLIDELWGRDVYELRKLGVNILAAKIADFGIEDIAFIEGLLRRSHTWALIDDLSINAVAPLLEGRKEGLEIRSKWSTDDDFWVRRTAMLGLLPSLRRGTKDWEQFTGYADAMLGEREFFIRKAIGWVLREVSKHSPDLVYEWMIPRAKDASSVTMREAVKYLPEDQRSKLNEIRKSS